MGGTMAKQCKCGGTMVARGKKKRYRATVIVEYLECETCRKVVQTQRVLLDEKEVEDAQDEDR
jgi:hypothetical protein